MNIADIMELRVPSIIKNAHPDYINEICSEERLKEQNELTSLYDTATLVTNSYINDTIKKYNEDKDVTYLVYASVCADQAKELDLIVFPNYLKDIKDLSELIPNFKEQKELCKLRLLTKKSPDNADAVRAITSNQYIEQLEGIIKEVSPNYKLETIDSGVLIKKDKKVVYIGVDPADKYGYINLGSSPQKFGLAMEKFVSSELIDFLIENDINIYLSNNPRLIYDQKQEKNSVLYLPYQKIKDNAADVMFNMIKDTVANK